MTTLHSIRQRIEALRVEARGLNDTAGNAALDAAAEARFAAIEAEVATLRASERRQAFIDEQDRSASGTPVSGDNRYDEARAGISLSAVIRAQLPEFRDTHEAGRAREISQEIGRRSGRTPEGLLWDCRAVAESRTLYTGQGPGPNNGAALVPLTQRADQFIDILRAAMVTEQAGARVLSGLQGDVSIPRKTATSQPAYVLEGAPLPLSEPEFDSFKLQPHTAGVVSTLSRNLVIQGSPDAEQLVMADIGASVGQLLDSVALMGSGAGATPRGIYPQATPRTYDAATGPSWEDILDALNDIESVNAVPNAWIVGSGVRSKLMRRPRSTTLSEGFVMTERNALAGVPLYQTGNMPAGGILLGDMSELILAYWSGIEIQANGMAESAFLRGNVMVRAIVTNDCLVRRPSSFVKLGPA